MRTITKNLIVLTLILLYPLIGFNQTEFDSTIQYNGNPLHAEEILSKYIQQKSLSGNEAKAGNFLRDVCAENGLHIFQMGNEGNNYNFAASVRPLDENLPNIIFLNHIDVVPAGDSSLWTYPPYSGMITDTEIWGRGAFDNKGAAIMQLLSVVNINNLFKDSVIPYNITFLAVCCEETQCEGGVKYVVDNYLEKLNPAVVIGEGPTGLKGFKIDEPDANFFGISVAHKRPLWLQLEIEIETSGHGSVTPLEYSNQQMVNALSKLTESRQPAIYTSLNKDLLKTLGDLNKGSKGFLLKHPVLFKPFIINYLREKPELFALFSNTITVTSINCDNEAINVVPAKTTALLDCRLLPEASREKFMKKLQKRLDNDNIKIRIIKELPPMPPSSDNNIFFISLKEAILKVHPGSYSDKVFLPNFNDTGIFRSRGIPAYSSIPIDMDQSYLYTIHNIDERIPRGVVLQAAKVYTDFVIRCIADKMINH